MTILRCNRCGSLAELPPDALGTTRPCPRCGSPTQVYDTVVFVGKVLERFFAMQGEVTRLRELVEPAAVQSAAAAPTAAPETFDVNNSTALTTELQHGPIHEWFHRRHIQVRTNPKAVDTTGFFDEVGLAIGKDYAVLGDVVDRIRFAQSKGHATATIHLDGREPQEAGKILDFCRQLYDYSFVAKSFNLKQEKLVRIVVQTAPAIREFFAGDWLEWYAFMTVLEMVRRRGRRYSCARNLTVTLQNGEVYELDVFFLFDGEKPLCIECKSGEFRQDIDRCLTLRKRLGLTREAFILCAVGLGTEQSQGLSSMYELSFANERDLAEKLEKAG